MSILYSKVSTFNQLVHFIAVGINNSPTVTIQVKITLESVIHIYSVIYRVTFPRLTE